VITIQPREPRPRWALSAPDGMTCVTPRNGNRHTADHHRHETSAAEPARQNRYTNPLHTASANRRHFFTTELVNNGLPIHIGAALLGHLSVQTTRGYVAVFNEDLIRHYQAFLGRRRQLRPADEYRPPTDTEWTEFEEHFDKRKVELGTCGRPYGTPCQHEFACLRCPVLQVDPKMLARLDEIEADLLTRRERAQAEGWRGGIEGLDLTLSFLRNKRAHTQRFTRRIQLGLPTTHQPAPRQGAP
jgi:hypothetical protein